MKLTVQKKFWALRDRFVIARGTYDRRSDVAIVRIAGWSRM